MVNTTNRAIVAYVPVLHQGYLNFFEKYDDVETLFLVSREELARLVPSLEKDIRALLVEQMKQAIEGLGLFEKISTNLDELSEYDELIIPDDEAMRALANKYSKIHILTFESIFLRWDKKRSLDNKHIEPDVEITTEKLHQELMNQAEALVERSADWWRQVGGVIAKNGEVLLSAYNHHLPNEQQPYFDGDPRANFHKGLNIEISTAIHTESALIAEAARRGLALEGADLYVTTFPCPVCAKAVAYSGIKRVFFRDGYSMVDGQELMKTKGVEIIKVTES
jgi:dCMP deaminase